MGRHRPGPEGSWEALHTYRYRLRSERNKTKYDQNFPGFTKYQCTQY